MNKAALIDFVAQDVNLTKKDARNAIESVINGIIKGLQDDGKVALVGFGSFLLIDKEARTARNPKTGAAVDVPAKTVPKFRPSATLKDKFENVKAEDPIANEAIVDELIEE